MRNTGSIVATAIVTMITLAVGYGLIVSGIVSTLLARLPLHF